MTRLDTKRTRKAARARNVAVAVAPPAACLELDVEAMMPEFLSNQSTQLIDDESGGIDLSKTGMYLEAMDERRYMSNFVDNIVLPGHTSMGGDACGNWGISGCDNMADHAPKAKKGKPQKQLSMVKKTMFKCNSKHCNVCYRYWHAMMTARAKERLMSCVYGRQDRNLYDKPRKRAVLHITVSPASELHELYRDPKKRRKIRRYMWRILKKCGDFEGGLSIDHAYRFRDEFKKAIFSPHAHFLLTGWLDYDKVKKHFAKERAKPRGLGHKDNFNMQVVKHISTLRTERDIGGTISYLLSHASSVMHDPLLEGTRSEHAIRWLGKYSYNRLSHVSESAFLHPDEFKRAVDKALNVHPLEVTEDTDEMQIGKDGKEYPVRKTTYGVTEMSVSTVTPSADITKPQEIRMVGTTEYPHKATEMVRSAVTAYLASPQSTDYWYDCDDCDLQDMHKRAADKHAEDTGHEVYTTSRQYVPVHVKITRTLRNIEKSTRISFLFRLNKDGLCPRCFSKIKKLHWLDQDNDPPPLEDDKGRHPFFLREAKDFMPLSDALRFGLIPTVPYIDQKGKYQYRTSNISAPSDLDDCNPLLKQTVIHQNMYDEAFMRDRFEVSIGKQNILDNLRLQVAAEKVQLIR